VEGKITLENGETVDFLLGRNSDARWGNTIEMVGHAVAPCQAMWDALEDGEHFEPWGA